MKKKTISPVDLAGRTAKFTVLILVSLFTAFPFLWMILSALKTKTEIMDVSAFFPSTPQWSNFISVVFQSPLPSYIWNSLLVSVIVVALQIFTGALLAYAMVFLEFKGRNLLFLIVMGTYMLPVAATYIPSYIILSKWNLLNTLTGLVISSTVSIFGIFLLRQAFQTIPKDLDEAARMDGCSYFRIYWQIMLPLVTPNLVALGIMTMLSTWKNLMWPIIVNRSIEKMTLSAGLAMLIGEHTTYYEQVMAGAVISVLPMIIIFMIFQKQFVEGIAKTGVKG